MEVDISLINNSLIDELSHCSLSALMDGSIPIIWIKNFYPPQLCQIAAHNILESPKIIRYKELPGFGRIGIPYANYYENQFSTTNNTEGSDYFLQAKGTISHIRSLFSPHFSPIDRLRLSLDETWMSGANIKTVNNQKFFAGIIRILKPELNAIPTHYDRYLSFYSENDSYQSQLAANIYLDVPQQGGDLNLWLENPSNDEDHDLQSTNQLAVCKEIKKPPMISVKPEQGDLIIFKASLLHRVSKCVGNTRIAAGLFIGANNMDLPLEYWS